MSHLLQMKLIQYECGCGEWLPLCNLFFCRRCSALRCHTCSLNEIDAIFCCNCLENIPVGEARLKKNRCVNCSQCPVCGMGLAARAVGETCHLVCSTCRWSTRDSDCPDQASGNNWPVHENPLETELNLVVDKMRSLATAEKAVRDQIKLNKRRSTNVGSHLTDRYGLQAMYQKRKKTFEKPIMQVPVHEASEDVHEFDMNLLSAEVNTALIPTLDSRIRQPLAADKPLRPVRMNLKARKALRCKQCDHNLIKLEYGPATVKYKIQLFARNFVPDIRLSREPQMNVGQKSALFLTVSNLSAAKAEVLVMADNQDGQAECATPVVQLSLPCPDETADFYATEPAGSEMGSDAIVFRRHHRVGIRLEVAAAPEGVQYKKLGLLVKYKNELSSMNTEQEAEWRLARVRISLPETEKIEVVTANGAH